MIPVVLLDLLSGCTPVPDMSVRLDGDELVFVTCDSRQFDQVRVSTVQKHDNNEVDLWVIDGTFDVPAGWSLTYGVVPPEARLAHGPDDLELGDHWINLRLNEHDARGEIEMYHYAHFDGDLISGDRWLTSANQYRDTAC